MIDFAITDCLVEKDGKFLIVEESKPGREGLFNIPGGHIDPGESIADATVREVKEETGYDVELTGLIGIYQYVNIKKDINVGGSVFIARVTGGEALSSKEHPTVRWVDAKEMSRMDTAGEFWATHPVIAMNDYLQRGAYPLETVHTIRI